MDHFTGNKLFDMDLVFLITLTNPYINYAFSTEKVDRQTLYYTQFIINYLSALLRFNNQRRIPLCDDVINTPHIYKVNLISVTTELREKKLS